MSDYGKYASASVAHGIMFHHFHGEAHPVTQGSLDADRFADLVNFVAEGGDLLGAEEWLHKAMTGRLGPNDLCLTFDDSLLCQKEIALPVLRSLGLTGLFFVYSSVFEGGMERLEICRAFRTRYFDDLADFYQQFFRLVEVSASGDAYKAAMRDFSPEHYLVDFPFYTDDDRKYRFVRDRVLGPEAYDRTIDAMIDGTTSLEELSKGLWMSDGDLLELAEEGHVIGLHSYSHSTTLADLALGDQESEYARNAAHITSTVGTAPSAVSHPCNSYTDDTLDILRGLGATLGFRSNMAQAGKTELEHPREDHANILAMMEQAGV